MLKYLLLILIVAAVWYGWRYVNRKPQGKAPAPPSPNPAPGQPPQERPRAVAEDLKPCPVCGTYMPVTADQPPGQTCGRPECRPA